MHHTAHAAHSTQHTQHTQHAQHSTHLSLELADAVLQVGLLAAQVLRGRLEVGRLVAGARERLAQGLDLVVVVGCVGACVRVLREGERERADL